MNQTLRTTGLGLLFFLMMALMSTSCVNSLESAAIRYRSDHDGLRLPDITVERLQACVEEYGVQLVGESNRVSATVQVNQEGQTLAVGVSGIPEHARDFASCTREVLRDMAVPIAEIPLRTTIETNGKTRPKTNEAGNVIVVGAAIVLAEFVAEYGGQAILFAVTVELVHEATKAISKLSEECRKARERCIDSCVNSDLPTGTYSGDPYHACLRKCMEQAGCF